MQLLAICLLIVGGAAAWWWATDRGAPSGDGRPGLAVLAFENLSGDARLDAFAQGLRADVLRGMAATRVFIILTSGAEVPGSRDLQRLGRDLGAAYLVDGTVQVDGATLHVTPRLIEAATGRQLWSEGFDRPLADAASVRAEIGRRIANALIIIPAGAAFRAVADVARAKPFAALTANDCVVLSVQERLRWSREGNAKALELASRAVELDPRSAAAQLQIAFAMQQQVDAGWAASREDAMARWLRAASAAVDLDPTYAYARVSLGRRYNFGLNFARAQAEFERAAALAPDNAEVLSEIGVELAFLGRTAEAVELTQRAARLDPNNDYRSQKSRALFFAGRFTEAAAEIEEITEPTRDDKAFAMLAYAELGRTQDMQRWLDRLGPQRTDFMFENWASTFGDFAPSASTQRRHWLDGLRKAGIPLCATQEELLELKLRPLPECEDERAKHRAAAQ